MAAELSVSSNEQAARRKFHLHVHFEFYASDKKDFAAPGPFAFDGIAPHIVTTQSRGKRWVGAVRRGHTYVAIEKVGKLRVHTEQKGNGPHGSAGERYDPWIHYPVDPRFLDDLWGQYKLSHEEYAKACRRSRVGYVSRMANVRKVEADEKDAKEEAERREMQVTLDAMEAPFRRYDVVDLWRAQYQHVLHRYRLLVIKGPSSTGKTALARSLIDGGAYVTVVNDADEPDLRAFVRSEHSSIVLDQVNSRAFFLRNRGLLQANNLRHRLGRSATDVMSYTAWLHRVPIIVTVDHDADFDVGGSNWLAENVMVLELTERAWEPVAA